MPTVHERNKKWLTQEILNLVSRDVNADGIPDVIDVNITGAVGISAPIPVTVVGGGTGLPSVSVLQPGAASSVANGSMITLLTYTVATKDLWLDGFLATGSVDAEYVLFVNTVRKLTYRTSEQDRTASFLFPVAQLMAIGTIIDLKLTHWNPNVADFDGTLVGHKY